MLKEDASDPGNFTILTNHVLHLSAHYNVFLDPSQFDEKHDMNTTFCATAQHENTENSRLKNMQLNYAVHWHVYGYSNYNDIKRLLERNNLKAKNLLNTFPLD